MYYSLDADQYLLECHGVRVLRMLYFKASFSILVVSVNATVTEVS